MTQDDAFARAVRKARRDAGLSLMQLHLLTGITVTALRQIEEGRRPATEPERAALRRELADLRT